MEIDDMLKDIYLLRSIIQAAKRGSITLLGSTTMWDDMLKQLDELESELKSINY